MLLSAGGWRVETSIFVGEFCGCCVQLGIAVGKSVVLGRLEFLYFTSSTVSNSKRWMESNIAS